MTAFNCRRLVFLPQTHPHWTTSLHVYILHQYHKSIQWSTRSYLIFLELPVRKHKTCANTAAVSRACTYPITQSSCVVALTGWLSVYARVTVYVWAQYTPHSVASGSTWHCQLIQCVLVCTIEKHWLYSLRPHLIHFSPSAYIHFLI